MKNVFGICFNNIPNIDYVTIWQVQSMTSECWLRQIFGGFMPPFLTPLFQTDDLTSSSSQIYWKGPKVFLSCVSWTWVTYNLPEWKESKMDKFEKEALY